MSTTKLPPEQIDDRLRKMLMDVTGGRADWKFLEEKTGISAEKWRNLHRGQTKASGEMIAAVSQQWPKYAFWLATGIDDPGHGHIKAEETAYRKTWRHRTHAWSLWEHELALKRWKETHGEGAMEDEEGRYLTNNVFTHAKFREDQEEAIKLLELKESRNDSEERIKKTGLAF